MVRIDSIQSPGVDAEAEAIIAGYRENLDAEMNEELAISAMPMRKGTPEDLLNNFVADLVLETARKIHLQQGLDPIDFCVLNYGGLRTSLPQGPVTRSRVFELMPFENEMIVLSLGPDVMPQLLDYIATARTGTPVSGIVVGIKDGLPVNVLINGQAWDPERTYRVVTSDYLAEGGDNMSFFKDIEDKEMVGMRIRDAIIGHLSMVHSQGRMIESAVDGRIYYINR